MISSAPTIASLANGISSEYEIMLQFVKSRARNNDNLKATVPLETAVTYLEPVKSEIRLSNRETHLPELLTHPDSIHSCKYLRELLFLKFVLVN